MIEFQSNLNSRNPCLYGISYEIDENLILVWHIFKLGLNVTCVVYNNVGGIIIYVFIFRIPRDVIHAVPTTFLLSLEGMPDLDWKRLRELQCPDGSFMSSPAPTAYALMQTGDAKCFEFLDRVVNKFNGSGMKSDKMMTRKFFLCPFHMKFLIWKKCFILGYGGKIWRFK